MKDKKIKKIYKKLLGKTVTLFCSNYFYRGKLLDVEKDCLVLGDPSIVYETGEWSADEYKDSQYLNIPKLFVTKQSIESFGVIK